MNKTVKRILLGLLALLVVIQLIPIDKSVPEIDGRQDFMTITQPTAEIATMLKDACYDCHSYKSEYPWYAKVAPTKFVIAKHIQEGREHLNFSTWGAYDKDKQDHKLEEAIEELKEQEMPLPPYVNMHPEADLSEEQVAMLVDYFAGLRE